MVTLDLVVLALAVLGSVLASMRWLRVAQREHYLAGSVTRFAWRWWTGAPDNVVLVCVGLAGAIAGVFLAPVALVPAGVAVLGPRRLGLKGRTSRLNWTRRLATTAVVGWVLDGLAIGAGGAVGGMAGAAAAAGLVAVLSPLGLDLALVVTRPLEERSAARFVAQASERLQKVHPLVIGVTGSFGKTTVKGYVAHLLAPHRTTLASPKSFNNRAGLARTVNEHLGPATEVLVAEMGTYGPGEIAAMCSWLQPQLSVITAIGPAHLERFKRLERTLAAKAEITSTARTVVLNVDDGRLAQLAAELSDDKRVVGASGRDETADVAVLEVPEGLELRRQGRRIGRVALPAPDRPSVLSNVACAAAVALELGVAEDEVLSGLASLPVPANRLQRYLANDGYVVFDDTFNSNPTGARIALGRLAGEEAVSPAGRRVVVTPGMVELGPVQHEENAALGEAAARIADHLVVVARTNRAALVEGARRAGTGTTVTMVERLDEALRWVRTSLGPGDAVLYEDDLPDHFP